MPRRLRNAAILTLSTLLLLELVLQLGALVVAWTHAPGEDGPDGADGRARVLCVGDSFTYGLGASSHEETSYPAQLDAWLEADQPGGWPVFNGGYPGRDSRGVLERIDAQLAAQRPAFVVVLVGLNDRWRQPERLDLSAAPAAARSAGDGFRFEWRTKRLALWLLGKLAPSADDRPPPELVGVSALAPSLAPDDPWRDAAVPEPGTNGDRDELVGWVDALPATPPGDALPRLRAAARDLATTAPRAALGASVRAYLMTGDAARLAADLHRAAALDDPALLVTVLEPLVVDRAAYEAVCAAFATALGWRHGDGIWLHPATGRQAALVTPRWLEFGPELMAVFETHRFHLEQVIARCRAAGAEPILLGYPNRVSFPDQLLEAIATATGARFVPTVARFEDELGTRDRSALFVPDGHCNDAGYALLARIVGRALTAR